MFSLQAEVTLQTRKMLTMFIQFKCRKPIFKIISLLFRYKTFVETLKSATPTLLMLVYLKHVTFTAQTR